MGDFQIRGGRQTACWADSSMRRGYFEGESSNDPPADRCGCASEPKVEVVKASH